MLESREQRNSEGKETPARTDDFQISDFTILDLKDNNVSEESELFSDVGIEDEHHLEERGAKSIFPGTKCSRSLPLSTQLKPIADDVSSMKSSSKRYLIFNSSPFLLDILSSSCLWFQFFLLFMQIITDHWTVWGQCEQQNVHVSQWDADEDTARCKCWPFHSGAQPEQHGFSVSLAPWNIFRTKWDKPNF